MPADRDEAGTTVPFSDAPPVVAPGDGPVDGGRATVKEGFAFASASFAVNAVVGMLSALLTSIVWRDTRASGS